MHAQNLIDILQLKGATAYDGEGVSQLEHAWQCGQLAKAAGATPALQLAAWLHDLGHLLTELKGTPTLKGIDDHHEHMGAHVLESLWGPAVAEPVRLHVQAKRYMVAVVPSYLQKLSADSVRSLALQGGAMSLEECKKFQASPYANDAQRLRAWDDQAKRQDWHSSGSPAVLEELHGLMRVVSAGQQRHLH